MIIHIITEGFLVYINVHLQIIDREVGMLGDSVYWTFCSNEDFLSLKLWECLLYRVDF